MARYGMLINTKKCIGCYACRVACQRQNDLLPTQDFIRYEEHETGTYPNVAIETVPLQCMHCEDAPCAAVCPTHATYITDSGVVLVDEDSGITFAIAVYTDSIYIKTVYNAYGQGAFRVGEKQQILRYAEKMGFRTERFEKKRRSAHV